MANDDSIFPTCSLLKYVISVIICVFICRKRPNHVYYLCLRDGIVQEVSMVWHVWGRRYYSYRISFRPESKRKIFNTVNQEC